MTYKDWLILYLEYNLSWFAILIVISIIHTQNEVDIAIRELMWIQYVKWVLGMFSRSMEFMVKMA